MPVDAEGLDVAALPPDARLVYVTPSHQFPLGIPMSLARRTALLDWADRRGAVVIEDDYDSEFRFSRPSARTAAEPRPRAAGSSTSAPSPRRCCRRCGSVSSSRRRRCEPALRAAKQLTDWHGDRTSQAALARFVDSGELARHVRKATKVYAERHELIRAALRDDFAAWLRPVPSAAGLHVCALAHPDAPVDIGRWVDRARVAGVAVESLAAYGGPAGLVLGYGAIRVEDVADGLRLLRRYVR